MATTDPKAILDRIKMVDEDNIFINYIIERLEGNTYRGWHVSQHNRYDLNDIAAILNAIREISSDRSFAIPPGDYTSEDKLPKDYREFERIVGKINDELGRGTINSVKKNFFPDLSRMQFLDRERKIVSSGEKKTLHGKLTNYAIELIDAEHIADRYNKYTIGIDKLFKGKISELAELVYESNYANDKLTIYEFMFILSDHDRSREYKIMLLNSFRSLGKRKCSQLINLIQEYANPKNFSGDKTVLRDFHNWKNQAQQILSLLNSTVYFSVDGNELFWLNIGAKNYYKGIYKRKELPKKNYLKNHSIEKRDNFEFHHIIPIATAKNDKEFKMIDDERNLIYIHKNKHREISQNLSRNIVLYIDKNIAIFEDIYTEEQNRIEVSNSGRDRSAYYSTDPKKLAEMGKYNKKLIQYFFGE